MTYRTKTGRILTEEDIDALVAEAERGYDIEKLTPRSEGSTRTCHKCWKTYDYPRNARCPNCGGI